MTLVIDGIDIMQLSRNKQLCILAGGVEFELNDLDGESSGRAAESGVMLRDKIAEAHAFTLELYAHDLSALQRLFGISRREFVTVRFWCPFSGSVMTQEFYSAGRKVAIEFVGSGGTRLEKVTMRFIGRGMPLGGSTGWDTP